MTPIAHDQATFNEALQKPLTVLSKNAKPVIQFIITWTNTTLDEDFWGNNDATKSGSLKSWWYPFMAIYNILVIKK